ncbi:hypothetical protein G6O69_10635 [Pseudenhygromyxa sp. WMMC2535]|uniref:hypothetical protein n=1 Tax=Pseudenhygromyxa sp. WMMC2535 TaxID=2712867 RepID=UPI001556A0D2|nr:hypothetical protein [Pseudenhygromyxa sp. WMMC2535]NVB38288.1 hypothetical protein [Pseudenhygromyxa sp. WMMC2535]
MRAKLQVQAGEPSSPELAARTVARALLTALPRQRPVTLAVLAFGPHPGLTPTPWVIEGVLEALIEAERTPALWLPLGDPDTAEAALRRARSVSASAASFGGLLEHPGELLERPSRDRTLELELPGQARPARVPRELAGSSLIVLTPLSLRPGRRRGGRPSWSGPSTIAAAELARAWGFEGARARSPWDDEGAARAGRALLEAVFASAAVVVDGTWAGVFEQPTEQATRGLREAPTRLLGELGEAERVLGLGEWSRVGDDEVLGVDHFLSRALGLAAGRVTTTPAPSFTTSPGAWPRLDVAAPEPRAPKRMADRAIAGIRSQKARLRSGAAQTRALPPRVPGRFAGLWAQRWFGDEHERSFGLGSGPR